MQSTNSSLFFIKITNVLNEFRNYLLAKLIYYRITCYLLCIKLNLYFSYIICYHTLVYMKIQLAECVLFLQKMTIKTKKSP